MSLDLYSLIIIVILLLFFVVVFKKSKHLSSASFEAKLVEGWIKAGFNFFPESKNKKTYIMSPKQEEKNNNGDTINIHSTGDHNTIVGKLTVGESRPILVDSDKIKLLEMLPKDKTVTIHVSAINGDNRANMLGQKIATFLSESGFSNLRGVHTVFVPLIEGVQIIKKEQTEYVILIGLV